MRYLSIIITTCIFIGFTYWILQKEEIDTTMKYFPFDSNVTFTQAETKLHFLTESNKNIYQIDWESMSEVDQPVYLRQDISLLYVDGRLKGIKSKWQEEMPIIKLRTTINGEGSSHYQAISYHHAEVHYPEDVIKSVQKMSKDELYIFDSAYTPLESFRVPENKNQEEWKEALDHATIQQLHLHWKKLIDYFQLPMDAYHYVPLTVISQYETTPIPNLTIEETQKVIAQLWEGLYSNYILPYDQTNSTVNSFVPLVLFDKKGTHLRVLYQDQNGEKKQLIQYYDSSNVS
ncbi:hypothetical protein BN1058_01121 [Paraliobacillus sp. PM-2]|uniref:hypothetical protein n=1 Tax=Paraliobacillus sp. PM-2 TaxID=1462524 RepID=UPI00061CA018|nr:hypothetical protein [Paraliobacillus sp. PM-2]CQR46844.1 hypothetical protein BN1058_01121 [Paraliobacillus sp. PM-2]